MHEPRLRRVRKNETGSQGARFEGGCACAILLSVTEVCGFRGGVLEQGAGQHGGSEISSFNCVISLNNHGGCDAAGRAFWEALAGSLGRHGIRSGRDRPPQGASDAAAFAFFMALSTALSPTPAKMSLPPASMTATLGVAVTP